MTRLTTEQILAFKGKNIVIRDERTGVKYRAVIKDARKGQYGRDLELDCGSKWFHPTQGERESVT